MTITYGFYNSVANDRIYDAVDISRMFDGVLTDGVFENIGNKFQVVQNSGMVVNVRSGKAWFNTTWTLNDADIGLTVGTAHLTLPRIDSVVLEINATLATRVNSIKIIAGTPNASPVPPTLVNTAVVHQYPLAYISVAPNATSILTANITQVVGTVSCPYVTFPKAAVQDRDAADVLKIQIFT